MSNVKAPGVSPDSILYYRPITSGNVVFGCLYVGVASLLLLALLRRRDWWALCLPIGAFLQGTGFFLRVPLADTPGALGLYVAMDFFIVLSPATYFAFNYIWFGRLCQRIEENVNTGLRKRKHVTFLSPRRFGLIFVLSDVTTFFIQAAGGGMQVKSDLANVGSTIFLIGIIAQFASYIFFICLCVPVLLVRMQDDRLQRRIRQLFAILAFSSVWIIVRSIYRTIQMAQGFNGAISRKESWFFGLDAAPLLLAIGIYTIAWPTSFVELKTKYAPPAFAALEGMGSVQQYSWYDNSIKM